MPLQTPAPGSIGLCLKGDETTISQPESKPHTQLVFAPLHSCIISMVYACLEMYTLVYKDNASHMTPALHAQHG